METETHVTSIVERDGKHIAVCSCARWESVPCATRDVAVRLAWLHRQANKEIK